MASFLDNCVFNATSTGTVDFVVATAVAGSQTPASANAVNAAVYRYYARSSDSSQWEVGYGPYTVSGTSQARTTVLFNSSGTTAKISFSTVPIVAVVALAEDLIFICPPQGRLTLQTVTPVMTTTQSAKTTIYYTPYIGNQIPIYDGTTFRNIATAEISVLTTDTTKSPAAIGASKVNDWFVWDDAGTIRLGHGPDWTSDTARSAGTALVMVNGILLNNASITNGPAASRGTYVGTTRSNGSSQLDWTLGTSAAGGGAAVLNVWNAYNRVNVATRVQDSSASYTYTSATIRQARASAGNQASYVVGLATDAVSASNSTYVTTVAVAFATATVGLNFDSTSTNTVSYALVAGSAVAAQGTISCSGVFSPGLGAHILSANENSDGANANTFDQSPATSGLFLSLLM